MLLYSKKINKACIHSVINVNICILNQALIILFGTKVSPSVHLASHSVQKQKHKNLEDMVTVF